MLNTDKIVGEMKNIKLFSFYPPPIRQSENKEKCSDIRVIFCGVG